MEVFQIHTMGSGDMSHGRAPAFDDHLDHRIIIFEEKQRRSLAGDVRVWRHVINAVCQLVVRHDRFCLLVFDVVHGRGHSPLDARSDTTITMSFKLSERNPSYLRPASNEIISASVLLWEAAVCFLQVQFVFRPPTNSTSWKRPCLHSDALTQDILQSQCYGSKT